MHAFELLSHWCCWSCVTAADDLDNEGDEIKCHESNCEEGSGNREDRVGGEVEVDHAGEEHIGKCVDP
jgi:hypothetical protein